MSNIKPSAMEVALTRGKLNKAQAEALSFLCRENPKLKFVENSFGVNGNTLAALVRRGYLENRRDPSREGYFFTKSARRLWTSQLEAEGVEFEKIPEKRQKKKSKA